MNRTERFRISGESQSQSTGIERGRQRPLSYQSVCLDPGPAGYSCSTYRCTRTAVQYRCTVLYFCLFCSAKIQSAELAGIRSAGSNPVSSIRSGRILRSCWHRFQSVYVFWQGCVFSRQQKFRSGSRSWIPCLLLDSELRDYEIKLDRRISAARESLQLFLFGN